MENVCVYIHFYSSSNIKHIHLCFYYIRISFLPFSWVHLRSNFALSPTKASSDPGCLQRALLMHFIHSLFTKPPLSFFFTVLQRKKQKGAALSATRTLSYCCSAILWSLVFELLKTDGWREGEREGERRYIFWMSCTRQHCKEHFCIFRFRA